MNNEADDLVKTLAVTVRLIMGHKGEERSRIAQAYAEAQDKIAAIALDDDGSPRPRILACFRQFDALKAADDIGAAGWMLTALQERIREGDLLEWESMAKVAETAATLLRPQRMLH